METTKVSERKKSLQKKTTSALAFRSAAMSCTLSLCSFGADLYMSNKSFISFWDSWAFLGRMKITTVTVLRSEVFVKLKEI